MTDSVADVVIVGAGAIGLAVASAIAAPDRTVVVIERHSACGRETSSRNSEVIHAGLYYPTGSLKARLCVRGNALLYQYCRANSIPNKRLGKVVIAPSADNLAKLTQLKHQAEANGVVGLTLLDRPAVQALEPHVHCECALLSPGSGILSAYDLVKALAAEARAKGTETLYRCQLTNVDRTGPDHVLDVRNPTGRERLRCRLLINCAGLDADRVSQMAGVSRYHLHWCKGSYFAVSGKQSSLATRLVYPLPQPALRSLGIHLTPDLNGRLRLGPDAQYVDRENAGYDVDTRQAHRFWCAIHDFLPELELESLAPDTAGIRPKIQGPQDPWRDFCISDDTTPGNPPLINLVGIESPGLTACLAIAEEVQGLARPYL